MLTSVFRLFQSTCESREIFQNYSLCLLRGVSELRFSLRLQRLVQEIANCLPLRSFLEKIKHKNVS